MEAQVVELGRGTWVPFALKPAVYRQMQSFRLDDGWHSKNHCIFFSSMLIVALYSIIPISSGHSDRIILRFFLRPCPGLQGHPEWLTEAKLSDIRNASPETASSFVQNGSMVFRKIVLRQKHCNRHGLKSSTRKH